MSIRAGVIGVGYLGRHHARIYSELEGVDLRAIIDPDQEAARRVADEYGGRVYSEFREALDEVDALSIVAPTSLHHDLALECLREGKDLLVEKPITVTIEEADALIEEAERGGRILQVGHLEQYNPGVIAVSGLLNEPRFFESERVSPFMGRATDVDVTLDLMIHDLDILLGFLRNPRVSHIGVVGAEVLTEKLDVAKAWMEFEGGAAALATVSRISREKRRTLKIFQDDSYIELDYQAASIRRYFKRSNGELSHETLEVEKKEPLKEELRDFVSCVRDRRRPRVSGHEGREALRIAIEITEKIKRQYKENRR